MMTATVSPKYQVIIPKKIREALDIQPGQKIHFIRYENHIHLVVGRPVQEMRGFLQGIDTTVHREDDRL